MCNVKSMDPATKNSMIAFNLIFQFLFYEARFSAPVRNWIYRKLTVELEELIAKTTVSKFFDKFLVGVCVRKMSELSCLHFCY